MTNPVQNNSESSDGFFLESLKSFPQQAFSLVEDVALAALSNSNSFNVSSQNQTQLAFMPPVLAEPPTAVIPFPDTMIPPPPMLPLDPMPPIMPRLPSPPHSPPPGSDHFERRHSEDRGNYFL